MTKQHLFYARPFWDIHRLGMIRKTVILFSIAFLLPCITALALADDPGDIRTVIFAWRDARQMKQPDSYRSFYSPEFQSGAYDYHSWLSEMNTRFKSPNSLRIDISEPGTDYRENRAITRFLEKYEWWPLSVLGRKRLVLVKT
jgi:hypothetical protein